MKASPCLYAVALAGSNLCPIAKYNVPEMMALAIRDGYGEIKSMFVDPDARGTGVAAGLMGQLEAEAVTQGMEMIRLETGTLLEAAQALYRRHGFTTCGPFGDYSAHPHSVFMEKRLA